jgi:hypothetical protein
LDVVTPFLSCQPHIGPGCAWFSVPIVNIVWPLPWAELRDVVKNHGGW